MQRVLKIKITLNQLTALNKVWAHIDFLDESNSENKAIISMAKQLAEKLTKKQISWQFKEDKTDKKHTLSFEYYQAYFFEMLLRKSLAIFPSGYENSQIAHIANELHQKLA